MTGNLRPTATARYTGPRHTRAGMAELADAKVSKTFERKLMGVRSPLPAPFQIRHLFATWNACFEIPVRNCASFVLTRLRERDVGGDDGISKLGCGHGQEFLPRLQADGYCFFVPVWGS